MKEWIYAGEGAARLQVNVRTFAKVAERAGVRRQRLPGMKIVRYNSDDVDRLARQSITGTGIAEKARAS